MTADPKLAKLFRQLDQAMKKLPISEAIRVIDKFAEAPENESFKPHLQLEKATALWHTGRLDEAVELLEQCTSEYDDIDSLYYFAGEYLVQLGQFARAIPHLGRCIELMEASGNKWYDAAYLLRAYCAAKLGKPDRAIEDLNKVDGDEPLSWVTAEPVVSKWTIRQMISWK
jgi:tetratricopeptide (TPR) repeat protein